MGRHMQESTVNLTHGQTRYFRGGEGEAVLLLHGVSFVPAALNWLPVAERLASSGFDVIVPDFLGWGPGGGLQQEYSFAYLVDFVREFEDALEVTSSHVVGHSMGGWIASIFAYESPERVNRLGLVASGGLATRQLAMMVDWKPPAADDLESELTFLAEDGIDTADYLAEAKARSASEESIAFYRAVKSHMSIPETRERYQTSRRLSRVKSPTLVLWGSDDDVNDVELAGQTNALLRDSELVIIPGADHFLPQKNPQAVADELVRFFRSNRHSRDQA